MAGKKFYGWSPERRRGALTEGRGKISRPVIPCMVKRRLKPLGPSLPVALLMENNGKRWKVMESDGTKDRQRVA